MTAQKNPNGHDMLFVHGATVSSLVRYLNKSVPYVWVLGHMPHRYVQWYNATIPLNERENITASVRLLSYDIQFRTSEFIEKASSFEEHGLVLIQAHKPMPNALDLSRIPEVQQDKVLIDNSAFLRIYLPHSVETACVVCYQAGYLVAAGG